MCFRVWAESVLVRRSTQKITYWVSVSYDRGSGLDKAPELERRGQKGGERREKKRGKCVREGRRGGPGPCRAPNSSVASLLNPATMLCLKGKGGIILSTPTTKHMVDGWRVLGGVKTQ